MSERGETMDTSGRQRRARRRIRGKSDFLTLDEIALNSNALVDGELATSSSQHGSERLLMLRVLSAWARAVGPHLKAVARPASCRQGRLMVDVRDAGWKRELERARPEILARMTRLLPDHPIREISFRLKSASPDVLSPPPSGQNRAAILMADVTQHETGQPTAAVPPPLDQIADGDLRNHLRQVMGRYLARSH